MPALTDTDIAVLLVTRYGPAIVRTYLPTPELRRHAWHIHQQIAFREGESVTRCWMIGQNDQLDDQAPIAAIATGHAADVDVAARAYCGARILHDAHQQSTDLVEEAVDVEAGLAKILDRRETPDGT